MRMRDVFILSGMLAGSAMLHAGPKAYVSDPMFDIGTVPEGQMVAHDFVLENIGDETLEILNTVVPRGSCVAARPEAKTVQPGASTVIMAGLQTAGMNGPVEEAFFLETNDPSDNAVKLGFTGEVSPLYVMTPRHVFALGEIRSGSTQKWEFSFAPTALGQCALVRIEAPEHFSVAARLSSSAAKHDLVVRTDGQGLEHGFLRGTVRLFTDSAEIPVFDILLTGRVVGLIEPIPAQIVLPVRAVSSTETSGDNLRSVRQVVLRRDPPGPFAVTGVETPDPAISVRVATSGSNSAACLTVTLLRLLPAGDVGCIVVHTDDPNASVVQIPVRVAVPTSSTEADPDTLATGEESIPPDPIPLDRILATVARDIDITAADLVSGLGRDEAGRLAIWLASRLCSGADRVELRQRLGGISLVRYARARDMIALEMARDPEAARRYESVLAALRAEAQVPSQD